MQSKIIFGLAILFCSLIQISDLLIIKKIFWNEMGVSFVEGAVLTKWNFFYYAVIIFCWNCTMQARFFEIIFSIFTGEENNSSQQKILDNFTANFVAFTELKNGEILYSNWRCFLKESVNFYSVIKYFRFVFIFFYHYI